MKYKVVIKLMSGELSQIVNNTSEAMQLLHQMKKDGYSVTSYEITQVQVEEDEKLN